MFISKKRFEEELEKARQSGFNQAMERKSLDDQFRYIHERIDTITKEVEKINQPKPVGFETGDRKC